jgi:putative ABC transport system ATP-binding protein
VDSGGRRALVKISGITQSFKVGEETIDVIKKCDFTVYENTFNIIYGPSGSGKSTLLNILSGIQKPTTGAVNYEGRSVYQYKPSELAQFRAQRIGVVYQNNYWISSLNVIENVSIPLLFLGYTRSAAAKLAMDALQRVDMAPFAKKSPLMLSGGEQQRVAMARAIASDPAFIIADEPTGSLDSKNGDMVMALLRSYNTDLNRVVILVTHNMEYLPLADQLIHIQDGICSEMANDDIRKTTDTLLNEMKQRIDRLSTARHHD